MHCMKCGRKIEDQKVFCGDCLTEMEKYPVAPDTAVYLPTRPAAPSAKKKTRKSRDSKPEEQLRRLRRLTRFLCVALVACLVAFALAAGMVLKLLDERENNNSIGQNYGTITESNH